MIEDLEGEEFASLELARDEAVISAREMMADELRANRDLSLTRRIVIVDEAGNLVDQVVFRDALFKRI